MAIRFNLKSCPLTAFLEHPNNTAMQDGTLHSVTALSAKAADLVERAKLIRAISDLEDEIALQMRSIGELVYATHRGTPSDSDELQKILEYVDDLRDEIEGHEQQLKIMQGIYCCPICGEDVTGDDVYCQNCGQPLPVPFPQQQISNSPEPKEVLIHVQ